MYPHNRVFVFILIAFLYLLALQNALGSFCVFPAPVAESAISLRSPSSLLENTIRNQDVGAQYVADF